MEVVSEKTIEQLTKERLERAIKLSKAMMERKRETQRQMREEWKTYPEKMEILNELRRRNAERGTPIISL